MTTTRKRWFVPPIKGLLEPEENPTPHPAREAMGLLWHIPEHEKRKVKTKEVQKEWHPEDDLPPEVRQAFKKREKRK